jgi:hypothetical protein
MNANATINTIQTITSKVDETNLPKKSNRGRRPKNTIEKTKQQITETLAKQNMIPEEPEIKLQTFHHNFSEAISERFTYFATVHRFDDRKAFKEAWQKWIQEEDVAADIQNEIQTLESNQYVGDILDKMFKSVRYYYRKKPITPKAPATRKEYVALPASVLESMDKHIIETMLQHTDPQTTQCDISPAKAFDLYMKQQQQQHQATATSTTDTNQQDQTIDGPKYKKTYKNRFFIASKNIRKISGGETA